MKHVLALCLLASPVFAQSDVPVFSPPAGCTAYLTVQSESCEVNHYFTCEGAPAGHQSRVSLDEQGMFYYGTIDAEAQWIESLHMLSGHAERLEPSPADPASLSELIATGVDSYDFQTLSDEIGTTRYVGADRLTGRQVTIDGVTLDETSYEITAYDAAGDVIWSASGNEFINRDWRMFLSGTGVVDTSNGRFDRSDRPVEFIFPGAPGFLSSRPKHGCGLAIS